MTKITTDFVGTETAAVTKQRISDILDYWGYEPDIYTTWGNARTDLNDLLAGTALDTIGASELAGTFLPKLNALNSPDELMQGLLFSNDEPGVFYDFDDWSTLFQDEAGTQPVTAANQGVALALDKRLGLELGPELVTNGTFDTDVSGWTAVGTGVTLASIGGQLVISTPFANGSANTTVSTVSGRTYKVTFDWIGTTSTGNTSLGAGSTSSPTLNSGNAGTYSFVFVATGATTTISARISGGGEFTATYDNISVRELKGNHATQATTAARPLTVIHPDGGVRNLLDRTEEFDNVAWLKSNVTVTANAAVAPDGTQTADKLVETAVAGAHFVNNSGIISRPTGVVASVYAKASERDHVALHFVGSATRATASFNLSLGTVRATRLSGGFTGGTATITNEGNGWYRCTLEVAGANSNGDTPQIQVDDGITALDGNGVGYSGDGTSGIFIWGAQLEEGSEATPYQKRVNFLDVTEAGKRSIRRLYFNGTSHFLQTSTITPNTDKAQVFAGVRKLSSAVNVVLELSSNSLDDNGSLGVFAPNIPSGDPFGFGSRGTVRSLAANGPYAPPITSILTGLGDISGDLAALRIDGAQVAQNTDDQGTGNYLAYQMFIGARAGTSLFFNGYLDQLITRFGANLDTGAIGTTEKYVSTKSPELVAASEVTWNASTDTYTQNLVGLGR
jgi:hypothetical protein